MAGQYSRRVRPNDSVPLLVLALAAAIAGMACHARDPLAEARAMQQRGDLYGSLEPLRALITEHPDNAEAQFLYGGALTTLGHVSQGEFSLEKAMEDPAFRVRAAIQLALGALRTADYTRAIEMAGRVLESEPDHVGALIIRAEARARGHHDLELALADADRAISLEPDRLDAQKPRILALLALDRIKEAEAAIADLGKQLEGDKSDSGSGSALAGWHCATQAVFTEEKAIYEKDAGAEKHAEERWKNCVERFPSDSDVVENAIEYYDGHGDRDRSVEVLRGALAAEPTADGYRATLAERLREAGKPEEGEAVLREAADAPEAYRAAIAGFELAEHFQALGDYAKSLEVAERAVERASELGPPPPEVLFEYADALLLADQLDRAEALASQMTVPAQRELVLARVAQERGDYRGSARHYDEAFRLWPDNGDARFTAGVAAEANGDFDRAIEQYRYAIRIQFGDTEARLRLARLYVAERKPALALEMLNGPPLPPDSEAELLSLRLRVQEGEISSADVKATLSKRPADQPAELARGLASVAEGLSARGDAAGALRLLRDQKRVSMRDPDAAPALRTFVAIAAESGQARAALGIAREAAAAHPDKAVAHELLGRALEASKAPRDEVRAAYARALELDDKNAGALIGLGRIALERDPNDALALFDRAVAADPDGIEAVLGGARALVAAGRATDAEQRLEKALPKHPLASELAAELADLRSARGEFSDETLGLARRAVRFSGSAEAWERLARVHEGRGDSEKAAQARSHVSAEVSTESAGT
jgi:tetratricopeptide (TPR) repeat protein